MPGDTKSVALEQSPARAGTATSSTAAVMMEQGLLNAQKCAQQRASLDAPQLVR
jgi:hypothetical protein